MQPQHLMHLLFLRFLTFCRAVSSSSLLVLSDAGANGLTCSLSAMVEASVGRSRRGGGEGNGRGDVLGLLEIVCTSLLYILLLGPSVLTFSN